MQIYVRKKELSHEIHIENMDGIQAQSSYPLIL